MEFLESSRSARKYEPGRTVRHKRTDPRSSNIVFGYDKDYWETTNKNIQQQVVNGSNNQGKTVYGDRRMTTTRKRGMLDSNLTLGNCINEWGTESKQHYHQHDLRKWGPRSLIQKDSYSWTEDHRRQLKALRDANNVHVSPPLSAYVKLPPIYSKAGTKKANGYLSTIYTSGDNEEEPPEPRRHKKRYRQGVSDEDDI